MIQRLSHATIYVNSQEEALAFYTQKLGFEVRTDITMDGFRWLTVGPRDQKDLELVLMEPKPGPGLDEETARQFQALIKKGALGVGVLHTQDCRATYEELKGKGVVFSSPPQERPYGIEAVFQDNSGNWFSLVQPR